MNPTEALLARQEKERAGTPQSAWQDSYYELAARARSLQSDLDAARQEIAIADELLKERNRVLAAIPECEAHGDQCVPHALEWIASVVMALRASAEGEPVGVVGMGADGKGISFLPSSMGQVFDVPAKPEVFLYKPLPQGTLLYARPAPSGMLAWAVERWNAEVKHRPLVNIHRRTLDGTWRQVIRYAGGDPDALVGPAARAERKEG